MERIFIFFSADGRGSIAVVGVSRRSEHSFNGRSTVALERESEEIQIVVSSSAAASRKRNVFCDVLCCCLERC